MVDLYRVKAGGNWDSFWKPGANVSLLAAEIADAQSSLDAGDVDTAIDRADSFLAHHHEYPISYTDGSPLMYRPGSHDGLGDAVLAFKTSFNAHAKLHATSFDGLMVSARLHRLTGAFERARTDATAAAKIDPDAALAPFELGTLQRIHSNRKAARKFYERALALAPKDDDMRLNLAGFLSQVEDYGAAFKIFEDLAARTGTVRAYHGLAEAARMLGRHDEAIAAARKALELEPNRHTMTALTLCEIYAGRYAEGAADAAKGLSALPKASALVVAETAALGALGRQKDVALLTDFRNVIRSFSIATPDGWPTLQAFNAEIKKVVLKAEGRIFDPTQTNNLFLEPQGPFVDLEKVIRQVVQHYAADLASSVPSPYFQPSPASWSIDGWATRLRVYKENQYHYHRHSWISGVYYASCPEDAIGVGTNEGWLEFCRLPPIAVENLSAEVAAIPPREGLMVLFPSYFHHRVLPFKAKDYRVSIAFNIIPDEGMA